jgi:MFS family permease
MRPPGHNARWVRLIPVAMLVYIISFMDRTNIGFAFEGMEKSLQLSATTAGLAGGIFFIGYLFLQVPGGHIAEHGSAKRFVGVMILIWGALAILSGFVETTWQLLVVRFFLGVAEGGIWPAILVLISHWFPAKERARAYGLWIINLPLASIVTAPLSGWIVSISDWRWLFIIEGIFPFIIASPLWWWLVADRPGQAAWVSQAEREYIETSLAAERAGEPKEINYRQVLGSRVVWQLIAVYFLHTLGFYGLSLWLPTLIKELTHRGFAAVGLIAAIPYVVAIIGLWCNGWWADKSGRYSWHVFGSLGIAAVALVASVLVGQSAIIVSLALISIAMGGALAYDGPFWAAASAAMPAAVAGGAMGLINALGNLGGFLGPYLGGYLQAQNGGNFLSTAVLLASALLLSGLVMLTVGVRRSPEVKPTVSAGEAADS